MAPATRVVHIIKRDFQSFADLALTRLAKIKSHFRIAKLFGIQQAQVTRTPSRALERTGMFHIVFFNYYDFMQGKKLKIDVGKCIPVLEELGLHDEARYASGLKPKKRDNPTLLRCPYMDEEHYRRLERELRYFGYRLMIDSRESHAYGDLRYSRGLATDAYMIESAKPGSSFGLSSYFSAQPTIYFVRDEDGPANQLRFEDFYFIGSVNGDESKRVADSFSEFLGVDQVAKSSLKSTSPMQV